MNQLQIKSLLYQECLTKVQSRYEKIKQAIADINESLEETATSSGEDELDNSRAMMQIDKENALKQLGEVNALQDLLKKVDLKATSDYARLGSLVKTNVATYFICISIGAVSVEETNYLCVALNSPIGLALRGLKVGESVQFNNQQQQIISID